MLIFELFVDCIKSNLITRVSFLTFTYLLQLRNSIYSSLKFCNFFLNLFIIIKNDISENFNFFGGKMIVFSKKFQHKSFWKQIKPLKKNSFFHDVTSYQPLRKKIYQLLLVIFLIFNLLQVEENLSHFRRHKGFSSFHLQNIWISLNEALVFILSKRYLFLEKLFKIVVIFSLIFDFDSLISSF